MSHGRRRLRQAGVVLLALAVLAVSALSFGLRSGATAPRVGVEWGPTSSGPVALDVTEDGPAWAAGLRIGDVLLALDGEPIDNALDASQIGWAEAAGEAVFLEVRRGRATLTLRLEPEHLPRPEPFFYLSIVGLAFWVSGMFVGLRWPVLRGGAIYPLLAFAFATRLTVTPTGRADGLDWLFYWVDLVAAAAIPALMLHLGLIIARHPRRIPFVRGGYAASAVSVLLAVWLSPGALGAAYRFRDPVLAVELRDRLEPLLLAVAFAWTIALLAKSQGRSLSAMHRSQQRWMLWGMGVGLGPFVLLYALPWAMGAAELPGWAQLVAVVPMLFVPAVCTAALSRYRLHDLDLIVLRSFAEVTALFCAIGIYAATQFFVREGINDWLGLSRSAVRYTGILIMIATYPSVRSWVKVGVDRAFYRKRYSYRTTLLDWARELNAETDLPSLMVRLRGRVRETLDVSGAEVWVRTGATRFGEIVDQRPLDRLALDEAMLRRLERESSVEVEAGSFPDSDWIRYLFPLKVKGRVSALLAIGERAMPGEPLTTEDRALLATLAAHAASAIEAARLLTEVSQRAEEIERLHARQAKILESSAVGLLLLGDDGRIQAWNRALEGIYGLSREGALGCRLSEVFPLHVVHRIERESSVSSLTGDSRIFRLGMTNRTGDRVVVNLAISPVEGTGETDRSWVVTFDDVTQRVELEAQVLRQERLASLGLLAAGVAHEINTPLTGISSYAQMLQEGCNGGDDGTRDVLKKIENQTERASNIANSLLNLANPERTSLEALEINRALGEVVELFEPQIRGRGVRLRTEFADGLPTVRGHRGKLQQVFLNLMMNARDALGDGGTIVLRTLRRDGDVVVEVSDDGAGIPEEDLSRIFDPFFTTKGRGKGTGLGLSISYGIVQELGGDIHVESQLGQFTRFRVELPFDRTAQATA